MATGYARQSSGLIITGATIQASHFNDEFDAILAFAHATSGHNHDGTAGGGAPLTPAGLSGLSGNGITVRVSSTAFAARTITAPAAGFTVTNGDGVSGNPTFVLANDLAALEALGSTGIATRTASDTWAQRSLAAPAAGFTITNPAGIAGDPTFVLANDLAALEALGSTGLAVRTASDTWTQRSITATGPLTATNGDGVSGNPAITFTGGRQTFWIPAGAVKESTSGGCATLATIATSANQPDISSLNFDATTQEYAQFRIGMPDQWNEGTVTAQFVWSHAATTTNFGVVWNLQGVSQSDGDAIAAAYGTAQQVTDTGGTTDTRYVSPETSTITLAGSPAAKDIVCFRVSRVATDGSDTLAVDARLEGVLLYVTTNAGVDA